MAEPFYPVMLDVRGRRCVVVGGGRVAARKARALCECGAEVVVIAPAVGPELRALPNVHILERAYQRGDLAQAWLAVAATNDDTLNEQVADDAKAERVWVNVVDEPARCSFILPAVARRGPIVVAVSTAGASPTLAARLRDVAADAIDPAYGPFADWLAEQRRRVRATLDDSGARMNALRHIAGERVFRCYRDQGPQAAAGLVDDVIAQAVR